MTGPAGAVARPDLGPGAYTYPPEACRPIRVEPVFDEDPAAWRDWHSSDLCVCGHRRAEHVMAGGAQSRCSRCAVPGRSSHPFSLDPEGGSRPARRRPRR